MAGKTAAILVNFNGGELNYPCIESLLSQDNTEIIVVDNASTDGSADGIAKRYGERVALLRMATNVGFARACNAGAALTSAEFLLFFNNDAVAHAGMVSELRAVLQEFNDVAVVGPVVLDARNPALVQSTGGTIDSWGFPVDPTVDLPADSLPAQRLRDAFFVSGCALMISAALFDALGGFDGGMFMFCEDVDLCWRAQLLGLRVVTARTAACEHIGGGTATVGRKGGAYRTSEFRIVEREKNAFRMMLVNLETFHALQYLLLRYPFLIAEAAAALLTGKSWVAAAYARSIAAALRSLPDTLRRRALVQATRRVKDGAITSKWSKRYEKLYFIRRVGLPKPA